MKKIAVIEDEPPLSSRYCGVLESEGYIAKPFLTRVEAEKGVLAEKFDAWVLDMKLGQDAYAGIGLIALAKDKGLKLPILVVSGLEPSVYRPVTLKLGVWDFVTKPVEDETLIFKIKQLLDVSNTPNTPRKIGIENLVFDKQDPGKIEWKGSKINLPITAWKFLTRLVETPGEVVTYDELFKLVKSGCNKQNLRQHIYNLRSEISAYDSEFDHIQSITAYGYTWKQ